MAENTIVLDADVKPLKKQLKEATLELQAARQKFGDLSDEAVNAAKKVAGIRDSIEDANEQAALFDPGKRFQALTSAASVAAGAVGAVQGAMALFGSESEDVQKALLKVQSAMALSQGLSQLADLGKVTDQLKSSFKGLIGTTSQKVAATGADTAATIANTTATQSQAVATNLSSVATKAAAISMKVLRGALISLGIPALVLGLVSLVQNFGAIKDAILNTLPGLKGFADTIGNLVQGVTDFFGITSKANRELNSLTKGTAARNESIETQIKLLSAQGGKEKEIFELKKKQTTQELQDIIASDRLDGKTTEERQKRRKELLTNLTLETAAYNKKEADEAKAAADKQAAEGKAAAEKAKTEREKINAEKLAEEKKLAEEQKALQEEKEAQDKEFAKRLNEILVESRLAGIKDENEKARAELLAIQEQELADLAEDTKLRADQKLALQKQLEVRNKEELAALEQSFAEQKLIDDLAELDAEAAKITTSFERQREIVEEQERINLELKGKTEKERTAIAEAAAEERKAIDLAEVTAKAEIQNQYLDLVGQFGGLLQQLGAKNKKIAIAGVVVEQSAAIGKIIANTAVANAKSVAATPLTGGLPFTAINTVSAGLSIASTIAGAVKAIQQINSGSAGGSGSIQAPQGISTSAPTTDSAVPTIGSSPVTALGQVMANQPPLKAYVVESEVTGTQKRVADIERRAGF
jgi:hypothetical protein